MKLTTAFSWLFFLAAILFLSRFELHTDDTGVEVFLMLAATFVLGLVTPRRAWVWASVPLCAPAADLIYGTRIKGLLLLSIVVTCIGFAGSYSGVACRKLFRVGA